MMCQHSNSAYMSVLAFRQTVLTCADQVVYIRGEGDPEDLNCLTLCKMVSLPNSDEGGWSTFS